MCRNVCNLSRVWCVVISGLEVYAIAPAETVALHRRHVMGGQLGAVVEALAALPGV